MPNPAPPSVAFLNPRTCGIYKDGGPRFKTDPATGRRTDELDNELLEHVTAFLEGVHPPGSAFVGLNFGKDVLESIRDHIEF